MKKVKTLCAAIAAALICTTPALAKEYEVPKYTLEGAEKRLAMEPGRPRSEVYVRSRTRQKFRKTSLL